jgi:hypothetical protein
MINQLVAGGENVVADNLFGRIVNPTHGEIRSNRLINVWLRGENFVADNLSGRIANPILLRNLPERKIRTNGENNLLLPWIYSQRCRVGANILNKKPCN